MVVAAAVKRPPWDDQMASACAAKAAGGGTGIGDQLCGKLGWQPAQEKSTQNQACWAGGMVGPQGQDAVHEDQRLLGSQGRQIQEVIDLLFRCFAIGLTEAHFELLVQVHESEVIVHHVFNGFHQVRWNEADDVVVFCNRQHDLP